MPEKDEFEYMEQLSKAYREAFAKRLIKKQSAFPEEKRAALSKMQAEEHRLAGMIAGGLSTEESRELAEMIKESASECLALLSFDENTVLPIPDLSTPHPARLLSRAVILANRCLNLLTRHTEGEPRLIFLILSELSALYALAAIN